MPASLTILCVRTLFVRPESLPGNNVLLTGPDRQKPVSNSFLRRLYAGKRGPLRRRRTLERDRPPRCRDFALPTPRAGQPWMSLRVLALDQRRGAWEQDDALSVLHPARAAVMASLASRRVHLGLIAELIGHSPIMANGLLRRSATRRLPDLPAGYEVVDLFILDWLAAEAV